MNKNKVKSLILFLIAVVASNVWAIKCPELILKATQVARPLLPALEENERLWGQMALIPYPPGVALATYTVGENDPLTVTGGRLIIQHFGATKPIVSIEVPGDPEMGPVGVGELTVSPDSAFVAAPSASPFGAPWALVDITTQKVRMTQESLKYDHDYFSKHAAHLISTDEELSDVSVDELASQLPEMLGMADQFKAHTPMPTTHVDFSPDGKTMLSSSHGVFSVREVESGNLIRQFVPEFNVLHPMPPGAAWFVNEGRHIFSYHSDGTGHLWHVGNGYLQDSVMIAPKFTSYIDYHSFRRAPKNSLFSIF
jgi:WD40 repeat protein